MAEPITVARPYAEAAFKLALESDQLGAWSDMLALIEAVVRDPAIASRVSDPNVDHRALEHAILAIMGTRIDGAGRNLVQVLVHNGRLELIGQIRALFEDLKREHEGVLDAKIVSALPLGEEQVRQMRAKLESKYGRRMNAQIEVDPELIGGVRIVIGDKVIDATVRGQLDAMAAALAH